MSRSVKAHILLVLVTLVWGATFVLIKSALADITPLLFNAIRMTLAGVALAAIYGREFPRAGRSVLLAGVLVGVFLWLGYEFQTTGLKLTTPSKSAFITGFSVILVPAFLVVWHRKVNRWTLLGVLVAFIGLYLMTVPVGNGSGLNLASINRGDLLTIGCAVFFACQIITVGWAMRHYSFGVISTMEALVAATLMFATVPFFEHPSVVWSGRVIAAILITGLLGTAAAFTIQSWAQQFTPPTHTALIFLLEPVFAWITSYLVLHERLGGRAGAGALLILGGILISELKGSSSQPAAELEESPAATS